MAFQGLGGRYVILLDQNRAYFGKINQVGVLANQNTFRIATKITIQCLGRKLIFRTRNIFSRYVFYENEFKFVIKKIDFYLIIIIKVSLGTSTWSTVAPSSSCRVDNGLFNF